MPLLIFKVKLPAPTIIALKGHGFFYWPKLTNVMYYIISIGALYTKSLDVKLIVSEINANEIPVSKSESPYN